MKSFYLENIKSKESYCHFIDYMISNSDSFSLVYFKYKENEKTKNTVKKIKKLLAPYKIYSCNGNQWPGTETLNQNSHIYKIILYKSEPKCKEVLLKVDNIYDWNYPYYPMDLCFYKDGYAWFVSCAHERFANLILEDEFDISFFEVFGVNLQYECDIPKDKLFLESFLGKG